MSGPGAQSLVTEYRDNCQHRLISIPQPNGQTASYRYDPFGRRISKTVDDITTEFFSGKATSWLRSITRIAIATTIQILVGT